MIFKIFKAPWLCLSLPLCMVLAACTSTEEAVEDSNATELKQAAAAAEAATLVDSKFMGREIYLRGEMNDYSVQSPYRLRKFEEDTFCTLAPLRSDWSPYRFKFADSSWSEGTNFGFAVPPAVLREGSGLAKLNPNSRFEELQFEPDQDGIYRFCIVYQNDVPYAKVTRLEDGKLTTMDEVIRAEIERQFSTSPASPKIEGDKEYNELEML